MAYIELVIKIDENRYKASQRKVKNPKVMLNDLDVAIAYGIPLPKNHGKIVDLGKIDEDRIEKDNPIIYLTVNGEYIEAVSLDYLNSLQAIIEENKEVSK